MGYSDAQLRELEDTINRTDCDVVLAGTPMDLTKVRVDTPSLSMKVIAKTYGRPNTSLRLPETPPPLSLRVCGPSVCRSFSLSLSLPLSLFVSVSIFSLSLPDLTYPPTRTYPPVYPHARTHTGCQGEQARCPRDLRAGGEGPHGHEGVFVCMCMRVCVLWCLFQQLRTRTAYSRTHTHTHTHTHLQTHTHTHTCTHVHTPTRTHTHLTHTRAHTYSQAVIDIFKKKANF